MLLCYSTIVTSFSSIILHKALFGIPCDLHHATISECIPGISWYFRGLRIGPLPTCSQAFTVWKEDSLWCGSGLILGMKSIQISSVVFFKDSLGFTGSEPEIHGKSIKLKDKTGESLILHNLPSTRIFDP